MVDAKMMKKNNKINCSIKNWDFDPEKMKVGAKVFHPFYGIGTYVGNNKTKKVLGKKCKFSTFTFDAKNLKVMLSTDSDTLIQKMIPSNEFFKVLEILKDEGYSFKSFKGGAYQRYKKSLSKIKSGNIFDVAEVLRDLNYMKKMKKRISKNEKKLLKKIKESFCNTISSVADVDDKEAKKMLNKLLTIA
ncbi:MAG: CarD family transcriptional regulator [Vulcanimicrobiota bacterium]